MQADYPKRIPPTAWDSLRIEYPVRKYPYTGITSEAIGRQWRGVPEVIPSHTHPVEQIKNYLRDYNLTKEALKSQSTAELNHKQPELKIHYKHSSCNDNLYIYPPSRRLEERVPLVSVHGTTEMRSAYKVPSVPPGLVTDKDQHKHHAFPPHLQLRTGFAQRHRQTEIGLLGTLPRGPISEVLPSPELVSHKDVEPLDTTHDGFEKYLDPYLTTNRLHHRPYTADQLTRSSASKDIITYHTLSKDPWTRTPKPIIDESKLPMRRPKSMYDREKFKEDFREIRTHNKVGWVPGSFRTEVRDNYRPAPTQADAQKDNLEKLVRAHYQLSLAKLPTNHHLEHSTIQKMYRSENKQVGSGKPLCSVLNQFSEKNKRLEQKLMRIGQ